MKKICLVVAAIFLLTLSVGCTKTIPMPTNDHQYTKNKPC